MEKYSKVAQIFVLIGVLSMISLAIASCESNDTQEGSVPEDVKITAGSTNGAGTQANNIVDNNGSETSPQERVEEMQEEEKSLDTDEETFNTIDETVGTLE